MYIHILHRPVWSYSFRFQHPSSEEETIMRDENVVDWITDNFSTLGINRRATTDGENSHNRTSVHNRLVLGIFNSAEGFEGMQEFDALRTRGKVQNPFARFLQVFKQYLRKAKRNLLRRSKAKKLLHTYGAPAAPAHTYVPAFLGFDPISILASLAFLAFLIQSFVSLFDRSRSIIPTIVSSRQSLEASIQDIAERVFRAMDRYELFNEKTSEEKQSENTV